MNEECSVIKLGEGEKDSRCSLNDSTNEELFQMKKMFQIKGTLNRQSWFFFFSFLVISLKSSAK